MSVYMIYKDGCDDCYIGSTTNIKDRIKTHKSRCNKPETLHGKFRLYNFIRDNGGWDE